MIPQMALMIVRFFAFSDAALDSLCRPCPHNESTFAAYTTAAIPMGQQQSTMLKMLHTK